MKKCPNCEIEYPDNDCYCMKCGKLLEKIGTDDNHTDTEKVPIYSSVQELIDGSINGQNGKAHLAVTSQCGRSRNCVLWRVIAIFAVVVFGGGFTFWYYTSGRKPSRSNLTSTSVGSEVPFDLNAADLDVMVQSNLSGYGLATQGKQGVYYSNSLSGIYLYSQTGDDTVIAQGSYTDLVMIRDNIYAFEFVSADSGEEQRSVVKINPETKDKQTLYTVPGNSPARALSVIDDNYFFTINEDNLFFVDTRNDEIVETEYRNVKQICSTGIFTSESGTKGLTFIPFDEGDSITYEELSNSEVTVLFVENEVATILAYHTEENGETGFYMWFLDIHTGALVKILYSGDFSPVPMLATANIISERSKYLISVWSFADDNSKFYYYVYDAAERSMKPLAEIESAWVLNASILDGTVYIINPVEEEDPLTLFYLSDGDEVTQIQTDTQPLQNDSMNQDLTAVNEQGESANTELPNLGDYLEFIDVNSTLNDAGILPLEGYYNYSVDSSKCKHDGDNYTEAIRFQYAGGRFSVDSTLYANFVYDHDLNEWIFKNIVFPEEERNGYYNFDIEGNWIMEGEYSLAFSPYRLAEGESELKVLIYDFVPTLTTESELNYGPTYGTFSWVGSNLSIERPNNVYGEGFLLYVRPENSLELWFNDAEGEFLWAARINASTTEYNEARIDGAGFTMVRTDSSDSDS